MGVPDFERTDPTYVDFVNANLNRAPRVYIGANDGMMHAFDAATGDEVWAYVPSHLFSNLAKLASRPFSHTYFVDGGTTVGDARFPDGVWHTILLGGLGSGAKGLFEPSPARTALRMVHQHALVLHPESKLDLAKLCRLESTG